MASASRQRRIGLVLATALGAYLVSPLARWFPLVAVAAAEDGGLGAGGAVAAYNFVLIVSIILAFIFGFAIRDVLHRHALRSQAKDKKPAPAPKRA